VGDWEGAEEVAVVDACRGPRPGRIRAFPAHLGPLPMALEPPFSTHGLGLGRAIEMARALGLLLSRLVVYAVGGSFGLGESMSPQVADAPRRLVRHLARRALEGDGGA